MRLYFGLVSVAALIAALSGAALSWDGSYYLYKLLDTGRPFVPPNRYATIPLHEAVLLVRALTADMTILQTVFGLLHAAIPVVALAASWWIVRREAPALFIWPAFSIGLGLLPGLFFFVGEGIQVVALFWPVLLATLLRLPRAALPVTALFGILTMLSHPSAIVLFLIAAAVAAWMAFRAGDAGRDARRRLLTAAGVFAVAASVRALTLVPAAASEPASFAQYAAAFASSVSGYPLAFVTCAWFAACMVLVAALIGKSTEPEVRPVLRLFQYAGLVLAGVLAFDWARHPRLWADALQFTNFALPSTFPFMVLAVVEGVVGRGHLLHHGAQLMASRLPLIQGAGAVLFGVLSVQSLLFANLTNELRGVVGGSMAPCISTESLGGLHGTPLGHWSVSTLAMALQGRTPQKVLLDGEGCVEARRTGAFRVIDWDAGSGGSGWFDLRQVRSRAEASRACWYSLSPGWYGVERGWYADWWRWSDGRGRVRAFVERDVQVSMRGELRTLRQPNDVEIVLNGARLGQARLDVGLDLAPDRYTPFGPLLLSLSAGENVIEILSANPAAPVPNDSRPLAIAVKNLDLAPQEAGLSCELQP